MKKILFTFIIFFAAITSVQAKYVQTCIVQYVTRDGWSKKYTVNVTYMTGEELNEATSSFKYKAFSVYAIIFWDKGQATIIRISTFMSCSSVATKSCITNVVGNIKGKDQDEDEWKICVSDLCY